jgi:hypothetical protein
MSVPAYENSCAPPSMAEVLAVLFPAFFLCVCVWYFFFFFFMVLGFLLTLARQALYHLSQSTNPVLCFYHLTDILGSGLGP